MKWYAVQIEPSLDRPSQYKALIEILLGEKYGLSPEQIWISGGGERPNIFMGYIFLHVEGDFKPVWESLSKERQICKDMSYLEIPDDQMKDMMESSYPEKPDESLNPLDVVKIDETLYRDLYGIVVDVRKDGRYELGLNFFKGCKFILLDRQKFHKVKSLFEIWKFKS